MANNVIDWVLSFTNIPCIEKFVGVVVADDANKVGTSQYLGSVRRIGRLCGISERRARSALRWWEKVGLMIIVPQFRENGSFTVNTYQLRITIDATTWQLPQEMAKSGRSRGAIMSTFDEKAFWDHVASKMDTGSFRTWMLPTEVITVEKNRLVIKVPTAYFADYLQEQRSILLEAARLVNPRLSKLHFILAGTIKPPAHHDDVPKRTRGPLDPKTNQEIS